MTEIKVVTLTIEQAMDLLRDAYESGRTAAQLPEKAWTLSECAKFLQISPETLSTLAQNGEIPCQRTGQKLYRFHPQAVSEWLAKKEK